MSTARGGSNEIAVVAIAGRFAASPSVEALWRNLRDGKECIRRYSDDELLAMGVTRADLSDPRFVRAGAALDGVELFDAEFFGIIPRYAELLDPQQRLLLECAWEVVERAGYDPGSYDGSIGVYVGTGRSGYQQGALRSATERMVAYASQDKDYAASRISHKLNLTGPSLTVQCASSTSLAAVHQACESLNNGECDMAIAGGACIVLPQAGYIYDDSVMFAPDGHCRAFDAKAAGTVPGNGAGLVLLKRLEDALEDRDQILAVIKGSALNNDGAQKVDYFAPSVDGQARVIREALAMAGVSPDSISYIEAHGTGTALGDPVEIAALRQVFPDRASRCTIGALKPNIGHLHTASGIAGLIKVVLMLQHRELVPTLHFERLNPHIDLAGTPFAIATERRPWTATGPLRAGVTALGLGGTNAHVVLEEAPAPRPSGPSREWQVLPLCARTDTALTAGAENLARHLEESPWLSLADVAYTLQVGRRPFERRRAIVCRTREEAIAALRGAASGQLPAIAQDWLGGHSVDWKQLHAGESRHRVLLPTYPFQRKPYWIPQTAEEPATARPTTPAACIDLDRLRDKVAAVVGIDPALLTPDRPLQEVGLESTVAPVLALELNEAFGVQLDPTVFYNHGTIRDLAAHLGGLATQTTAPATTDADRRIAVIGMSGRFPGAPDLTAFWKGLVAGEVTRDHQLAGFDCFDSQFFRISPREAQLMDPQQRVFLEESWKALEDAAYSSRDLEGRRVGVFAGAQANDYAAAIQPGHGTIGNSLAILSARISYYLNLKGPALTVDTACSSGLVAVHLACQSLRSGECEMALAGGVSVCLFSPAAREFFENAGMLSASGDCRPFDADADGMVPADGVGVLVLKPLAAALRDGDAIRAVISATGVNQDGRTAGITAPSAPSQTELLRETYQRFAIDPATIGYVEAHGTGTRLGDPIELQALTDAFRGFTPDRQFCAIGSVKANIGHALPAAGAAGLLKAILSIEHRRIVATAGFSSPNPLIRFGDSPFFVPLETREWTARLRAAVSSFGFSGTNAHIVLDEAPARPPAPAARASHYLIALSGRDDDALRRRIEDLHAFLDNDAPPDTNLRDLSYTLNAGRTHFDRRAVFIARDLADLVRQLAVPAADDASVPETLSRARDQYLAGADPDWKTLYAGETPRRLSLPSYPFAPIRHWLTDPEPAPAPTAPASDFLANLRQLIASELYLEPHNIRDDASFIDLGLDSILAVELAKRIKEDLGIEIRATEIYETGSLRALATKLTPAAPTQTPAIDKLRCLLASALYLEPNDIRGDASFVDLGLDSILAVELAKRIKEDLGVEIRATEIYETGSLRALAARVGPAAPGFAALAPQPPAPPVRTDDIAIIGVSGRYPMADDLREFWSVLRDGRDCISEIPADRWSLDGFFDPDRRADGKSYSKWGGFLRDVDKFDALFFQIAPRDAELMDPQERLFLETSWAALENAGYTRESLGPARKVGVFAGVMYGEYQVLAAEQPAFVPAYSPYWSIANRVSYVLNLRGPSMAVDTACSSSLTAVHLACDSLRRGECTMAIAGGVNLSLHPRKYVGLSHARFASSDGRCRSFGEGGDGYVPGEGVGALILKPLAQAIADGDHIWATIKATAINHGGKSTGYPVPTAAAQSAVIAEAVERAGVAPQSIGYFEAHGTGTSLGDPIELEGIAAGLRAPGCAIGSVKSNIGHLEAAAGVAAITKVILQMRHGQIAPSLHAERLNPELRLPGGLHVQRELSDWTGRPRRAGISSFGAGGSNAHAVLEEFAAPPPANPAGPLVFVLSARTEERLRAYAGRLAEHLREEGHGAGLADIAHTLRVGREQLEVRLAVAATTLAELIEKLEAHRDGRGAAPCPIDWTTLDRSGPRRRVPLPSYPFERKSYWLPQQAKALPAELRDHRVNGQPILPGVCCLEVVRAARGGKRFDGVVWQRPVTAPGVTPRFSGDTFEVVSTDGSQVHCSGKLGVRAEPPARLDLDAMRRRCPASRTSAEVYRRFEERGVTYGASFQLIDRLHIGAAEALAEIRPITEVELAWLDAAGQAAVGCCWEETASTPFAPFAADAIEIFGQPSGTCFAHVRRLESSGGILRFDVAVADSTGAPLASIRGLALKGMGSAEPPLRILEPVWVEEAATTANTPSGAVLIVTNTQAGDLVAALRDAYKGRPVREAAVEAAAAVLSDVTEVVFLAEAETEDPHALTRLAQAWMVKPSSRGGVLRVVTRGVQRVLPDDVVSPWAAGAIGVAKVLVNEVSTLRVQSIDLPTDWTASDAHLIASETRESRVQELAYRGGRRFSRRLREVTLPAAATPFRRNGVYLIVGGAGGLGMALARRLAKNFAARIAIVGRAPAEQRQGSLREVEAHGGESLYCRADVANMAQMRAAVAEVQRRWGRIDGAVHSALVLADRSILRMDEESFRTALDPKAKGAIALIEALGGEARDFVAFFSSANSFYGNAGQANYVAGCVFQDAYAEHLRADGRRVAVLNWGYWGEVGAVATDAMRERLSKQGLFSIREDEGLDAFERVLANGVAQAAVVKAAPETLSKLGLDSDFAQALGALEEVEEYGRLHLRRALDEMGMRPGPARSVEEWRGALGILPQYASLLAALCDMLAKGNWLAADGSQWRRTNAAVPSLAELDLRRAALTARQPLWTPYVELLDACLSHYPDILRGRMQHMEALFPKGSLRLVEAIYRGNHLTDFYNDALTKQAAEYVDKRAGNVRILEVGAGTGGTTKGLLPILARHAARIEYVYTDLSPAFLRAAEDRFRSDYPFLRFQVLDIEKDVATQSFPTGEFDLVIAANVIHATRRLRESLGNCRALLRPNGLLLLNESTRVRDFATLTFGLTTGWWRFEDPDYRAPHSPVASQDQWRRALREAGFQDPRVLSGAETDAPFQAIIAAAPAASGTLEQRLIAVFAKVLKLDSEPMRADDSFDRYGVESVTALEIVARLEEEFGDLPKTLLFEHNTIRSLAQYLERERGQAPEVAPPPRRSGDIAIVGLSGRYPGAETVEQFWENIRDGKDSITEIPPERWNHWPHYDPTRRDETKSYTKYGGFLQGVEYFDAPLFRLSPHDAKLLDPQERLFLETAWTLLEDAGYSPERLARASRTEDGGDVGVFVGVMSGPYETISVEQWAKGHATGAYSSHSSIANRVSYWFDFRGPSLGIDTACSSSLTAVHLACESIRRGECRAAIAGGVNLLLHPLHHVLLSYYRVLTASKETRPFGADADGFVVGEGVGAILLRPLDDAIRDGDRIYGVIKGTAINASGRTSSYSAPSAQAQADVIAAALRRCGVDPHSINYIEAHGTGTELGDPVEIRGLQKAFDAAGGASECAIGSVKSNIGHLEAASGIAGLTKVLLQMRHGELAPSLHAETTNPFIDFRGTPFTLQRTATKWDGIKRAGVSSFGMGGANAHVILEEYRAPVEPDNRVSAGPQVVVVSANSEDSLRASLANLRAFLTASGPRLRDVAWTLQVGRQALDERWAAVVNDVPDLIRRIDGVGRIYSGNARSKPAAAAPSPAEGLDAVAASWTRGAAVDWDALAGPSRGRRIALPAYPFERKRYWLTDGLADRGQVATYYDSTAAADAHKFDETYLSLAPFAEPVPGFSWTRAVFEPARYPQFAELLLARQRELRRVLFRDVDFCKVSSVFDFGCGLGTDLIVLARQHAHLRAAGYSISTEHARIAAGRIASEGLQGRVTVAANDSASAPFPGLYDVIFGIEVAHHIENKDGLFANIASHLAPAGRLVLVDCLSATAGVHDPETGSFTLNIPQYADLFARHGLRIATCIDASREIANCLTDAEIDASLTDARARGVAVDGFALVETVHRSWDHFGKALAAGLMRYVLVSAESSRAPHPELTAHNRRVIETAQPYTAKAPVTPASPQPGRVQDVLRRHLQQILQASDADLASNRPFADLGLDSLSGLKFVDAINNDLGLNLGAETIYDHPTLPALTRHLVTEHGSRISPSDVTLLQPPSPHDIAIVGISVRYPGATNLDEFWANLAAGRDSVAEVPPSRWDAARHYSPDPERLDTTYGKWAGLLPDFDRFDPLFFNISPREAEYMDPQQRLFLEETWKALEDAGYAERHLSGARCGVFAGVLGNEYQDLVRQNRPPDAYAMLGNAGSILAARISYLLNLRGPSLCIDTACSSSLVAVDLACKALQQGGIDIALAGGVALYLTEQPFIQMSRAGLLSKDGKCRTFDHRADGIAPGEGVGVVVLKRLTDALSASDHIYGVIRSSATNQDGRTNGITAPSAASQTSLIVATCDQAGIDPATITCVEAHGTGTPLGDPIEVTALAAAYTSGAPARAYCALGAVKTNIGHTSAAAGIAGLAKLVKALEHRQIPPLLHFEAANERIRLADSPFYVNTDLRDWRPAPGAPLRAALSSFGFSGTNAHLILDEPPASTRPDRPGPHIAAISAKTEAALQTRLRDLAELLDRKGATLSLADVCFTLNTGRQHYSIRRAFVARDCADLAAQLRGTTAATSDVELSKLAAQYEAGGDVDWDAHYAHGEYWRISLPPYPLARDRYWCDPIPASSVLPMLFEPEWVPTPRAASEPKEPATIVHTRALLDPGATVEEALVAGAESVFMLAREVNATRDKRPVRIAFVYRHDGSTVAACHAAVAAMAKSLALVDSGISLTTVGVTPDVDDATAIRLATNEVGEVLYRGSVRHERRIREIAGVAPATVSLGHGSVCVITGGLGGIPYLFAQDFARRGVSLVLIGRSELDSPRRAKLEALGCNALYLRADVSDRAALASALSEARARFGSIDAVIHAAGSVGSKGWLTKSLEEFRSIIAVKARGAVLIDELTREDRLQFFAMFSSLSSTVGDFGEGDYSAANRFLSEFAQARKGPGRTLAIEWPMWDGGGIQFPEQGKALFLKTTGMTPLTAADGVPVLGAAIAADAASILVAKGDRQRLHAYLGCAPAAADGTADLREIMAEILRIPAATINPAVSFTEYGFDSITLKEFAARIERRLGIALSPVQFFANGTLGELAAAIGQQHISRQPAPAAEPAPDAIAVIGMSGVFPQSPDLETFWRNLIEGRDLITPPPAGRDAAGPAGFISDVYGFDADFFQISAQEAAVMDPHHRVLLETIWKTVEDAGHGPLSLAGSRTGIFVGAQGSDFLQETAGADAPQVVTGATGAMLANRVSYLLDWRGPSEVVDTACSSSLVAVHRAVQALRSGEADLAIAAGVSLLLSARTSDSVAKMGVLSPDGRCKVFDRSANGYVRGEGAGAVLLKPLARAIADGDPIRGVILASGVNHGGRATSLTAPNPKAQAELLSDVWKRGGAAPQSISYIEAHGTGTELGDPIEVQAMQTALSGAGERRCGTGSVKSNMGHLEPASGVASLIKVLMALERRVLPPTLHCNELNPHIRLDAGPVFVVKEPTPWDGSEPRRAGVSSFGFGGVNAHVLVQEAPPPPPEPATTEGPQVVPISARTTTALRAQVEQLRRYIAETPDVSLSNLAFTLQSGRDAFEHRYAVVCGSLAELAAKLDAFPSGAFQGAATYPVAMREILHRRPIPIPGRSDDLARAWAEGACVDWSTLRAGNPRRLSLPTYPFEHKTHRPATAGERHHLTPDHPWVRDHRVQGQGVLAGAAMLEMVRAYARASALRDVTWTQPVVVGDEGYELTIRLHEGKFEVTGPSGIHAQGSVSPCQAGPDGRILDIEALRGRVATAVDGSGLYAQFAASGLDYGPSFRCLDRVWTGDSSALGEIRPGAGAPAVLDAAMQTGALLLESQAQGRLVPFSFDALTFTGDLTQARYAWVQASNASRLDLTIADAAGRVLAEWAGLYARAWREPAPTPLSLFVPVWKPCPDLSARAAGRAIVFRSIADFGLAAALRDQHPEGALEVYLGATYRKLSARSFEIDHRDPEDYRKVIESFPATTFYFLGGLQPVRDDLDLKALDDAEHLGVLSALRLAKALPGGTLRVVTNDTHAVVAGDRIQPDGGALGGFVRAFSQEFPDASACCVDVTELDLEAGAADIARMLAREDALDVAYRAGRRYVRELQPVALPEPARALLRSGGVYCIVGGAGGLGTIFARHLAARYSARLLLIGRSAASENTARLVRELEQLGGAALYRQADAADLAAMRAALEDARAQWGGLNGVICSSLVLRNGSIPKLTEADFTAVLRPKAQAAIVLEQALRGERLDFIALFSSAISLTQAAGQSNYAAASSFQDAAAPWLAGRLGCPVKLVNWGYWGEQGIVATPEHRERMRRQGVGSIRAEEGISVFERLLGGDATRIVAARLLETQKRPPAVSHDAPNYFKRVFAEIIRCDVSQIGDDQAYETLGIDSLVMLQIVRRLEQDLGPLPKTLLFEHTTIRRLSDHLAGRLKVESPSVPAAVIGDIAIVGISGRYPMSPTLDDFWENLRSGRNCISEIPASRWDYRKHYHAQGETKGKSYSKWGGFIDDIDRFDALFFGISAREAAAMDPQERLFLETAWSALEDAGYTRQSLAAAGGDVGVFVGVMHGNYQLLGSADVHANSPYWSIANRVSYWFDFHGPSLAVDTACSSSLAAVHLACESIRRGECRAAIAGGVNLIVHPKQYVVLSAMKMLSHGDRDRSFGAGADGFVLGEGVGAVLLRPLADAQRDGDRILAVIKSSALNAGGKTPGYTVPNPASQSAVVRRALEQGNIDPATIGYVEAHGTGTSLGDPIEVTALTDAFRRATPERQFCALGSVKSNIGHLEAAAGIAALTKVILQLEHRTIAPTLHASEPNPHIDFASSPFILPQEARSWNDRRRAGISSFGAGGTNVHLIVEEAPPSAQIPVAAGPAMVPLSARSPERLRAYAGRLAAYLSRHPEVRLQDVAHTLQVGREAMAERVVFPAGDLPDLIRQLTEFSEGHAASYSADEIPVIQGHRISLPGYPFERSRHWVRTTASSAVPHPLIDHAEPSINVARFVKNLSVEEFFLKDHKVAGTCVLPGVAHLEIARAAAAIAGIPGVRGFASVRWLSPLTVDTERSTSIELSSESDTTLTYEIRTDSGVCGRGKLLLSPAVDRPTFELSAILRAYEGRLGQDDIYAAARAGDIEYGPRFRALRSLSFRPGEALSEIVVDAETASELATMELHPVILDAALQSVMGTLLASGKTESMLPFEVERIDLFAGLGEARYVYVRGFDLWILDESGIALVAIKGLHLREVRKRTPMTETEALEQLEEVGRLRLKSIFAELRPAPKHDRLHAALRRILGRASTGDWTRLQRELLLDHPAFAPHLTLLDRCMGKYREILSGEMPATEAFFPGGSMETVEAIYRGSAVADHFHRQVAELVSAAVPVRVLEIGAGTGGTTVRVLEALVGRQVEFFYTDISSGFTHFGKTHFGRKYPFMKFAVLDIEKEIRPQGFETASMDVVYASNVLHATKNIRETLTHARDLLKPGGTLILNEMTAARDYATLTFGLLDGWFRFEDAELRIPDSPLLSVAGWEKVMRELGLEWIAAHGEPGQSDPAQFQQAVMASRKSAPDGLLASIEAKVVQAVAEVFEMTPESVRAAAGASAMLSFTELGADSILSAELVDKINTSLGLELKTTAIFNYPGIKELARHIHDEHGAAVSPPKGNGHSANAGLEEVLKRLETGEWTYEQALENFGGDLIQ